ncbi:kinase-like protein [Aspergillus heteromorphus CBS 117.55]|uniref:non-specific serine/threonine protein kinase n=1 Tax=Aspergillus heteromorphus CBS 117.55 TaxID=1448321 RepID=A0A317VEX6_9EURO|nr:kinase-like protein [Aspergillus heteromorphus CBS 117.55]PWY71751.1 kinase-like protein [Aspergillus heteromorphus CBS 117.55]
MFALGCLARPTAFRQSLLPFLHARRVLKTGRSITTLMEPSKVKYGYIDPDDVERVDYYVPGGYHPVYIGDEFHSGRYVVIHKLGFGRSATTWLAEDKQNSRMVALKISTAEAAERTAHEWQFLTQLTQANSQLPGNAMVQTLLDSFLFSGPNGSHRCLVMDPARVNINEAKEAADHRILHLPAARAIAAQLVLGVQFIHSQGIVHGNLHLGNILLRLPPSLQHMTPNQLYKRAGKPEKEPVIRCDGAPLDPGVPSELIVPLWLGLGSDEITLSDCPIILADFGEAFNPFITKTFICHTPHLLAPPEAFFAGPDIEADDCLSFPADIWTLACTIWEIFGSAPPFEVFVPGRDSVTREHVDTFGKLPDRWWGKWENRGNWFDEDGRKAVKEDLRQYYTNDARDWDQRFPACIRGARRRTSKMEEVDFGVWEQDEERAFGRMVKSMLVLEPRKRATIEDVVGCEWMRKWGLPELRRMEEKSAYLLDLCAILVTVLVVQLAKPKFVHPATHGSVFSRAARCLWYAALGGVKSLKGVEPEEEKKSLVGSLKFRT